MTLVIPPVPLLSKFIVGRARPTSFHRKNNYADLGRSLKKVSR